MSLELEGGAEDTSRLAEAYAAKSQTGSPQCWVAVIQGCLVCFFCGGVFFGWPPLQLLLENDGVYAGECSDPEEGPFCEDQKNALIYLYSIGVAAGTFGSPIGGILTDRLGPCKCTLINGAMITAGMLLYGITEETGEQRGFDGFVLGSVLIGVGGMWDLLTSFPLTHVVPAERQPVVSALVNCLFDASSVVFLFVFWIYNYGGLSRQWIFISYAVLTAVLHLALALTWATGAGKVLRAAQNQSKQLEEPDTEPLETRPRLRSLALMQQLPTFEFGICLAFTVVSMFRANAYLGTVGMLLGEYGDSPPNFIYMQIYTSSLPMSVVCVPLIDRCLSNQGFKVAFPVIALLGLSWAATSLVVNLPFQILSFAAFTLYRSFLFSGHFSYISHTFGSRTCGRVGGLTQMFSGMLTYMIHPAVIYFNETYQSLWLFYAMLFVLSVPPLVSSMVLRRRLQDRPADDCDFRSLPGPLPNSSVATGLTVCHSLLDLHSNASPAVIDASARAPTFDASGLLASNPAKLKSSPSQR